jgi:hypothetical protein
LNSALALARGNPASLVSMLGHLHPARGVYTAVARGDEDGLPLIGQVSYVPGERSARLSFLMAQAALDEAAACALLENLIVQAGTWGAANVLAEVAESETVFTSLRRVGFAVYSRQEVWRIPAQVGSDGGNGRDWSEATPVDAEPVLRLCQALLPPLVQSAEEMFSYCPQGLVVRREGQVVAYVQVLAGPHGICLQPLFHPEVTDVRRLLGDLVHRLPGMVLSPVERPVYCLVRSYQAGLAGILAEMGAQVLGEQALLVKHLAIRQRKALHEVNFSTMERHVRSTSPMVHHMTSPKKTD